MIIREGTGDVPVIYTAHHASHDFGEFSDRVALTDEQRLRFSDYGTAETVPDNGIISLIADRSRGLGDLNRDPDDPGRFQLQDYGQPTRHDIWKNGMHLTDEEKAYCQSTIYEPYHDAIIEQLRQRREPTFVIAWDDTAHYMIGDYTHGKHHMMRPFILSNRGQEGSGDEGPDEPVSCDPHLLRMIAEGFAKELGARGLPNEVSLNFVMKGGYICRRYSTLRNADELRELGVTANVQSLQIEYDTILTHDQTSLVPDREKIAALKQAFSVAVAKAILRF